MCVCVHALYTPIPLPPPPPTHTHTHILVYEVGCICEPLRSCVHPPTHLSAGLPIPNFLVAMMAFFLSAVAVLPQGALLDDRSSIQCR